jgi:hypothetical protein
MMRKDYITYNIALCENLMEQGFKRKNKNEFIRKQNQANNILLFAHGTYHERFVRYYTISVFNSFPEVDRIVHSMGTYIGAFGLPIGVLCNNGHFKDWRIADNDAEPYIENVVNEMTYAITDYAIPFLDKYSTYIDVIQGFENKEIHKSIDEKKILPILYLIVGEKEKALDYIDHKLDYVKQKNPYAEEIKKLQNSSNRCDNFTFPINKSIIDYTDFANRFRKYAK